MFPFMPIQPDIDIAGNENILQEIFLGALQELQFPTIETTLELHGLGVAATSDYQNLVHGGNID